MNVEPRSATRYDLSGSVNFTNALEARAQVDKLIDEQREEIVIGLGGLTEGSSLLVALLMGWLRHARQSERRIQFVDVPPKLAQLLEFTGLDSVLPITRDPT